jgi:mRNA interferase MazF
MPIRRGDVVLVPHPFSSGAGAKLRPALVVQNDSNNSRLANTIVAQITSTTRRADQPTQLLIDVAMPDGRQTGLKFNSAVTCENLATIEQSLVRKTVGTFTPALMSQVDDCLRASLNL